MPSDGVGMKMKSEELSEAFEVPREFASAMDRLGSQQVKRSLELMGQCVQVRYPSLLAVPACHRTRVERERVQ